MISSISAKNSDSKTTVSGNLDGCDYGHLVGWAWDIENQNNRIHLDIFIGKNLVETTCADIYRSDLHKAKIGKGNYGFRVSIAKHLSTDEIKTVSVIARESKTLIGTLQVGASVSAMAYIEGISNGHIHGFIETCSDEPNEKLSSSEIDKSISDKNDIVHLVKKREIQILIDGDLKIQGEALFDEKSNKYKFSLILPTEVYDGNYHYYSIEVSGEFAQSEVFVEKLSYISTDWKYINQYANQGMLATLPKIAGYRYIALRDQLDALGNNRISHELANQVNLAHNLVVQGPIERAGYPELVFPKVENPEVSIVIPVHNQFATTYHCLASLLLAFSNITYEVVVVDDCSSDRTVEIEDTVKNIGVVRNTENLGFLRSVAAGSTKAVGSYLVLLNNDTEVTSGWLDSLYSVFNLFDKVGAVGSKLIYPDGTLQEAGGIVWNNGKPWNYGNGENAEDPRFNYTRQADYLSGASIMIEKSVWEEVGGFSDEFAPAYYEDTDLAFKIRDSGYKTFYCPDSVVIHYEGKSNGTNLNEGIKRFQNINAPKFRSKWRSSYRLHGNYGKNVDQESDRNHDFRVLVIDNQFPMPNCDAGGYAAVQEMSLLQELGCKVTFIPNNMTHLGEYTSSLQNRGIECIYRPFFNDVSDFISKRGQEFDLVYITRFYIAEDVLDDVRANTNAKVLFNNADLHFLREIRSALEKRCPDELETSEKTRERELKILNEVDAILSYNETEHSIITSMNLKSENIFLCPWVRRKEENVVDFNDRQGIAFLGGFGHLPNIDAVKYFVDDVMPILRKKIPDIKFHIYGSKVTKEIELLACEDVIIEGFVENLSSVFDSCRVFVAPLISGAGIKGKVIESFAYGVPSVLSPIASESTGAVDGVSALIANSPEEWAEAISYLYTSEDKWNEISKAAQLLLEQKYSLKNGLEKMRNAMSYLELDPQDNKLAHFKNYWSKAA